MAEHASVIWLTHFLAQPVVVVVPPTARAECRDLAHLCSGVPQRDPLSALLFCATMTWALKKHLPGELQHVAYVDDVVVSSALPHML